MKLKNKKTGEIGELLPWVDYETKKEMKEFAVMLDNHKELLSYSSLAELNSEWEDVPEEPKVGYIIDPMGEDCVSADDSGYEEPDIERAKELSIWLETKEEAELAVRKLKAWKRLEDKGFGFCGHGDRDRGQLGDIVIYAEMPTLKYDDDSTRDDLDLLFGGEE